MTHHHRSPTNAMLKTLTWSTDPSTLPINIGQVFGGYQDGSDTHDVAHSPGRHLGMMRTERR
jgi:hypothetical protein